jgi:carbonic anhydrase/acetyltransferase-like protein (isoleucine patch superfamily)
MTIFTFSCLSSHSSVNLRSCGGQTGSKHIYGEGFVSSKAHVSSDAYISEDAEVCDRAYVGPGVKLTDRSKVYGRAKVFKNAVLSNNSKVFGRARISSRSTVKILEEARVYGNARIEGNSTVFGNASIFGESKLKDNAIVCEYQVVKDDEIISDSSKCNSETPESESKADPLFEVTSPFNGTRTSETVIDLIGVFRSSKINSIVVNDSVYASLSSGGEFIFNDLSLINGVNEFSIQAFDSEGRSSDLKTFIVTKE